MIFLYPLFQLKNFLTLQCNAYPIYYFRCPAGVGIWGACFLQPSVPTVDPDESSFENPFLGKLLSFLLMVSVPP